MKEFKVGDKVWYKGETSGGLYNKWVRFEVVEILDSDHWNSKLLLRRSLFKDADMKSNHDFTVACQDGSWTRCLPDTRAVRKMVKKWNTAKELMEDMDEAIEHYWIDRLVHKPRRTESCS